MKVYIVRYSDYDDSRIIGVYATLEKANEIARREISDDWRTQDGYTYQSKQRKDGTIDYYHYDDGIIYFTTIHEVKE